MSRSDTSENDRRLGEITANLKELVAHPHRDWTREKCYESVLNAMAEARSCGSNHVDLHLALEFAETYSKAVLKYR